MDMLQHRRQVTIAELCQAFDVDRRTVQRDVGILQEAYAVEEGERTPDNLKTFRLAPSARGDALKLTLTEMIVLYMGRNFFTFTEGTDLKEAMESLYAKLKTRLCERNASVSETLPKKFYCTAGFPKSYRSADDVLNDVLTALTDERKLHIVYQIPGRPEYEDIVHPYTLVVHNNALYLVCHSERAGAIRNLAVERIQSSNWRDLGTFDYPTDYEPGEQLRPAFGISTSDNATHVQLVFSPHVAPYVAARQWHPTMQTRQREDGFLEVDMHITIGEEIVHWLTGYGGAVKVLAPDALREQVLQRHRQAL